MAHPTWPLFDLEVATPRLTLRYPTDDELVALAALAAHGVHDPSEMPFAFPWTDAESPAFERNFMQFHWKSRGAVSPASWTIDLAVFVDDQVVGSTGMVAQNFGVLRGVGTGSWLGLAHQGNGIGTEMRIATLQFAFIGLGALEARTCAYFDNPASLAVTRKVGYVDNGVSYSERRGERTKNLHFRMERDHFDTHVKRDDITLTGLDSVRNLLGLEHE